MPIGGDHLHTDIYCPWCTEHNTRRPRPDVLPKRYDDFDSVDYTDPVTQQLLDPTEAYHRHRPGENR